jgi:DNA-binding CsgD family transcriptional regulator
MSAMEHAPGAFAGLTDRELEVLRLLAAGHTAKTIAVRLGRSETAIHELLRAARRKTGIGSSRELARLLDAQKNWDKNIDLATHGIAGNGLVKPAFRPPAWISSHLQPVPDLDQRSGPLSGPATETRASSLRTVRGAGGEAQALGAARDGRVVDRLHVDAVFGEQDVADLLGAHGVSRPSAARCGVVESITGSPALAPSAA